MRFQKSSSAGLSSQHLGGRPQAIGDDSNLLLLLSANCSCLFVFVSMYGWLVETWLVDGLVLCYQRGIQESHLHCHLVMIALEAFKKKLSK